MGLFRKEKPKEPVQAVEEQRDEAECDAAQYIDRLEEKKDEPVEPREREEKKETETKGAKSLQEMSMPELWQRALSLGVSRKGSKEDLIERIVKAEKKQVADLTEETDILGVLEQLRTELKEFERIREGIRTKVESTSKLVPQLNERKELLEKELQEHEQKIAEIADLIPKLEDRKENLRGDVQRKRHEIEILEKEIREHSDKISEISGLIPRLSNNKRKIQESMEQKQKEISRINEQINQILNVQKYGIDLVSTLLYANHKRKQSP